MELTEKQWDRIGYCLIAIFGLYCLADDPDFFPTLMFMMYPLLIVWLVRKHKQWDKEKR